MTRNHNSSKQILALEYGSLIREIKMLRGRVIGWHLKPYLNNPGNILSELDNAEYQVKEHYKTLIHIQ